MVTSQTRPKPLLGLGVRMLIGCSHIKIFIIIYALI